MILRILGMLAMRACARRRARTAQGKTELLWYSQAAFKITTPGGKVIMIDPWIMGATKIPPELKDLAKIGKVDLDPGDARPRRSSRRRHGDLQDQQRADLGPAGMNQWLRRSARCGQSRAAHEQGRHHRALPRRQDHHDPRRAFVEMILKDESGKDTSYPAGEPVGFIIQMENGFKIYHMGDTGVFSDMKWIGEYYKPDLILIPIGGHYVMDPKDAAYATRS
jgi:hypothetical protein